MLSCLCPGKNISSLGESASWVRLGMTFFLNPTISEKKNNPSFILAQKQMSMGEDEGVVRRQKMKGSLGRRWHITKEMAFNETNGRGSWLVFLTMSCPHIP